jgi:hypothetical protein
MLPLAPRDLRVSTIDVTEWLRSLGLEQYAPAFRENGIDDRVLLDLTAEDLKDLGVSLVGHRRLLLKAIGALRPEAGPAADPPTVSATWSFRRW